MTLAEILDFVESKESGKRSDMDLESPELTEAVGSSYRRQAKPLPTPPAKTPPNHDDTVHNRTLSTQNSTCYHCGSSHSKQNRQVSCPAFGSTCNHCSRLHHLRKSVQEQTPGEPPKEARTISHTICTLKSTPTLNVNTLEHNRLSQTTIEATTPMQRQSTQTSRHWASPSEKNNTRLSQQWPTQAAKAAWQA